MAKSAAFYFSVTVFIFIIFGSFIPKASAEVLERVPTDHATIAAAVGAVSPGGTVLIEDSSVYVESFAIQTANISIVAAPGETPTIQYDGNNSYIIFADQPCQVGSNTGGRITIDGNNGGGGTQTHVFRPLHSSGEVRFENLDVRNVRNNPIVMPDAGTADTVLSNVDIDGGGVLQFGIRLDFLNSVLTLNCVNYTNVSRECIFTSNPSTGTLNVNNSYLEAVFQPINLEFGSGGNTLNIDNSYIHESGGVGAFGAFYVRGAHTINMTNSVVQNDDAGAFAFYHYDADGAGVSGPSTVTFDHCDLIADFPFRLVGSDSVNNQYTITNTNMAVGAGAGSGQLLDGPNGDDTTVWDYNNVQSGAYAAWPVGANDLNLDPVYTDPGNGDYTYSDATVLTGDDSGGPIGNNAVFPAQTCVDDLVIRVPTDYASIQDAINAVADYGTIRIEDSGVYAETLNIQKPGILIEAAPCESPVLRYDGSNSYMIFSDVPFQFGSNSGGRIIMDENDGGAGTLSHVFRPQHASGLVVYENLGIVNMRNTYVYRPDAGSGDVYMNNVDADGLNATLGLPVPSFIIRLDNLSGTFTMNCCNFRNMGRDAIFVVAANTGTINILNSYIQSTFDAVFFDFAVSGFTMNVDNSYIHESGLGGGGFSAVYSRGANTFNFTNSVIRCDEGGGFGFFMFDDQAGSGPTTAVFDHCDFIADFPMRLLTSSSPSANNLTVTNCNFRLSVNGGGSGQLLGGTDLVDDTVVWDYNNVVSNSYGTFPVGPNDIQVDPLYNDTTVSPPLMTASDFRINDATVLVADASGNPIGTNANFNAVVNIPTVLLDYTEGTGFEVDVVVPDFLPAAQPKIQPVQIFSENVQNVAVSALNLVGPDGTEWGVTPIPPVVVNKSCPVSVKVAFDPTVTQPTAGLMATLEVESNDFVTGTLTVDLVGDAVGMFPGAANENWALFD